MKIEDENMDKEVFVVSARWMVFPAVAAFLTMFLSWGAVAIPHPTKEATFVLFTAAGVIFLFGVGSLIIFKGYKITLEGSSLTISSIGCKPVTHDLSKIVGLRMRGIYVTLDYGKIPRVVILVLSERQRIFAAIERHASLPRPRSD